MRPRRARGAYLLGMAATIALLGFLAYAVHAAAYSSSLATARLRWRVTAQRLAEGGVATARIRLAEDPTWKGELWDVGRLGQVALVRLDPPTTEGPGGANAAAAATWIEARAEVPAGHRPFERAILRAALAPAVPSSPNDEPTMEIRSMHWVSPGSVPRIEVRPGD